MTLQAYPLRRIFHRFFPRKYAMFPIEEISFDALPKQEQKELARQRLCQGELALLQGNLHALSLFESAALLDGENPEVWFRQGLAFFEYGSEAGKEKSLLLSSKYFKMATELSPTHFHAFVAWGEVLLQLGRFHEEHHFFLEAKKKYERALELKHLASDEELSELFWDFGICLLELARYSGEALDLSAALDLFDKAEVHSKELSSEFFNDFGNAYLEMGLLINDSRYYLKAVEKLQQAVQKTSQYSDGWQALAESYSQLYVNTLDERYASKASETFEASVKVDPKNERLWLGWAQILGESGAIGKNLRSLRLSVEKIAKAYTLDRKNPETLAQWIESLSHLGYLSSRLDLLAEAENKAIKATDRFPDDPDLWRSYGIALYSLGRYYEDSEYYELSIEKLQWGLSCDRTHAELWHSLAQVHLEYGLFADNQELLLRSIRFFQKAIDLKPSCPQLIFEKAKAELAYSETAHDLFSLEKAIEDLEHLLQQHSLSIPYHPSWLFIYAKSLYFLSQFSQEPEHAASALDLFSQVLLLNPDYPGLYQQIGSSHMELGQLTDEAYHYKQAIHFFQLSLKTEEENEQIWLDFGLCLIHLANHTFDETQVNQLYLEAEGKLHRAGQLGNIDAYYQLACLNSILYRTQEALRWIHQSLHAHALPTLEEMAEDDWLDNLKETRAFQEFIASLEAKLSQMREE